MRRVVEGGIAEFYEGSLGDEICATGKRHSTALSTATNSPNIDPYWEEPLSSTTYRDYESSSAET